MTLLEEIKQKFASGGSGSSWRSLSTLSDPYKSYVFKDFGSYGVAFSFAYNEPIKEYFSNCKIYTATMMIEGQKVDLLCLSCDAKNLRNEFATICAEFLDPGTDGSNRHVITADPIAWWKNWRDLMGNKISERQAYSVIAEMAVLEYLIDQGKSPVWTAANGGSNDIETDDESFEVKSTTRKYEAKITISSEYQLQGKHPLFLYFCRMESSPSGKSIDDMVELLVSKGIQRYELENQLTALDFEVGRITRKEKYKIIERRWYKVDENFPKIVDSSFIGGKKPDGISHIQYTIDLDTLDYKAW